MRLLAFPIIDYVLLFVASFKGQHFYSNFATLLGKNEIDSL